MKQKERRKLMLTEICVSKVLGVSLSTIILYFIAPHFSFTISLTKSFLISLGITAASMAKNYAVRSYFQPKYEELMKDD